MVYGIILILIIAITGGLVAFVGDKIGSKIGKKRIRLFGMRPHQTSVAITIVTGTFIAVATIMTAAVLSDNVRTALFGMQEIEMKIDNLNQELIQKTREITINRDILESKNKELTSLQDEIDIVQDRMQQSIIARNVALEKLQDTKTAYEKAEKQLLDSQKNIKDLKETKEKLLENVNDLNMRKIRLETTVNKLREGDVVFKTGEVLSGAIIQPNLTLEEYEFALARFLEDTNRLIKSKLKYKKDEMLVYIDPKNIKEMAKELVQAKGATLVRTVAVSNVVYGEPTIVRLEAQPYELIYKKKSLVYEEIVDGGENAEGTVLDFLREINAKGKEAGIIPGDTGKVGTLEGSELYRTIAKVRRATGKVKLVAVAAKDIYTEGPLAISVYVENVK